MTYKCENIEFTITLSFQEWQVIRDALNMCYEGYPAPTPTDSYLKLLERVTKEINRKIPAKRISID